jgi:hypothetical protein
VILKNRADMIDNGSRYVDSKCVNVSPEVEAMSVNQSACETCLLAAGARLHSAAVTKN